MRNITQRIIQKIRHIKQKKCCICGAYFDEYLFTGTDSEVWKKLHGIGAGIRKANCPNCGSTDRERLIFLFFKMIFLPHLNGEKISLLHIAPEPNLSAFLMSQPKINYVAGDKHCKGYTYPEYVKNLDITDMSNIHDNTFDVVICNHVLEHVDSDITAMKEIYRIIKHGGFAIIQVPIALKLKKTFEDSSIISSEKRFSIYGQSDHVRLYGIDYPCRLKQAGFSVDIFRNNFKHKKKYGLNCKEKIFICKKK